MAVVAMRTRGVAEEADVEVVISRRYRIFPKKGLSHGAGDETGRAALAAQVEYRTQTETTLTFAELVLFFAGVALLLRLLRPLRRRLEARIYRLCVSRRPRALRHVIDITESHKKDD